MKRGCASLSALGLLLASVVSDAASTPEVNCSSLVGNVYGPATIIDATWVPQSAGQVEHCAVRALKIGRPEFEVGAWLPADWVGVMVHGGGGGLDGSVPSELLWSPRQPLQQRMVFIASNSGHRSEPALEGKSLAGNPEGMLDYSYRAIGTTYEFGAALIADYYGHRATKSYFVGCSRGGTEAMQAASHYPNAYDGIVAQAPAPHMNAFVARVASYPALTPVPESKWEALYDAYMSHCDALDGVEDGIVGNRAACRFDATTLPSLTASELRTVQSVTGDLKLTDGTVVNRGYGWGPQFGGVFAAMAHLGEQWMRYPILDEPGYDPKSFDLDKYWPRIVAATAPYAMDVDPRQLAAFLRMGRKMLIFMGADDPTLSIDDTIAYQRQVQALAGAAAANTQMYLLPGVGHCGVLPSTAKLEGAESVDMLGALRDWVEKGRRPAQLTAVHLDPSGRKIRSRPLCVLGSYPKYNGKGDVDAAASFTCERDGG